MPAYIGSSLVVTWTLPGGTVSLSGKYLSFSYTPSIDWVEVTAGPDTSKTWLAGLTDGAAALSYIDQGTPIAIATAMAAGTYGTLVWTPFGTGTSTPKYTMAGYALGANQSYTYNGRVEYNCNIKQSGLLTIGTN